MNIPEVVKWLGLGCLTIIQAIVIYYMIKVLIGLKIIHKGSISTEKLIQEIITHESVKEWEKQEYEEYFKEKLMSNELNIHLNKEELSKLLRSNLSCHLGKTLNQENLSEITLQIIDSIDYFLNNKEIIVKNTVQKILIFLTNSKVAA